MASDGEARDSTSCRKVAQLRALAKGGFDVEYFERILQRDGNINYEVKNSSDEECSVLHLAHCFARFDVFELLLNHGANYTVKDSENHTVIHKIISNPYYTRDMNESENQFVDSVLSAHVQFGNHSNPSCKYNISHFHVACMRNNAETVQFFLKNGVDVNQTVSVDSPIFPGYTPLHFAAEFSCLQVSEILLKYGSDVHAKNAIRLSPLMILIKRKIDEKNWSKSDANESVLKLLVNHVLNHNKDLESTDSFGLSKLHIACIIDDTSFVKGIFDKISNIITNHYPVYTNSPVYPGYTPLHFAALFNVDTVKLLIEHGADIEAKEAQGVTALDVCLQIFSVEDIHSIISSQTRWKNITLSDDKTKLVDIVAALVSVDGFGKFLAKNKSIIDLIVPADSPLWPGYTFLHLAVVFSEKGESKTNLESSTITKNVEECLARGADVTKTDAHGSTALHLAFYLQKLFTVKVLLQNHRATENPTDSNDLSYFHIACAARDESAVERFLSAGVDVNAPVASTVKWHKLVGSFSCQPQYFSLAAGSTALHVNVACGHVGITRMLLENGADVYAKDVHDFTPIHLLFPTQAMTYHDEGVGDLLLSLDGLQDRTAKGGLTHLHVACHLSNYLNVKAAERLLDSGADVNAVVSYGTTAASSEGIGFDPPREPLSFLSRYSGFTPLHFAMHKYDTQHQRLLVERGADIFAGNCREFVPIQKIIGDTRELDPEILGVLMNSSASLRRLKNEFGVTRLHVACYAMHPEWIRDSLLRGEDVNSQVGGESAIWPGYTPLHLAARNVFNGEGEVALMRIFKMLLDSGADVRLKNGSGDTPLHLIAKQYVGPLAGCRCAHLLLSSLKDFEVNAAHLQGMSFFHFACLIKHVPVVREYLKNGIDVNKSVDLFAERYPGYSPLHLAMEFGLKSSNCLASQIHVVNLLLNHKADVLVKDVYENTLLHSAASLIVCREQLFDKFIRSGVDVDAENIFGETALEVLIKSRNANWVQLECLLKHGSRINSFNTVTQEGYMAKLLNDSEDYEWKALEDEIIRNLIDGEYYSEIDDKGRTILHNLVSINNYNIKDYVELIERVVRRGCDINCQDKEGRTALHVAAWFRNTRGIIGLIKNGADVNISDKKGKTPFNYCFESPHDRNTSESLSDPSHVINIFAMHVHRMEYCGLHVSEVNKRLLINALQINPLDADLLNGFNDNVRKSKSVKIGSTDLTLYDFGFKIDTEMVYPSMPLFKRLEIDQFFEQIQQQNLPKIDYLLKQKLEICVERLRLIDLAVEPFITLVKNQLPDLCCRVILSFLSRSDLENIIALKEL